MNNLESATVDIEEPIISDKKNRVGLKGFAWASLEWARSPYYYTIVIYIFVTYFSDVVIGDNVRGQTLISLTITISGLVMAVIAPVLGVLMDRGGKKKPAIFIIMAVIAHCALGLFFVEPNLSYAIPLGMILLGIAYSFYSLSELFHNSMLPAAGSPPTLPVISGLGVSLGNSASVTVLILCFYVLETQPLGLDSTMIARLSGPFVAVWMALFLVPFFLFMKDDVPEGNSWGKAFSSFFSKHKRPDPIGFVKEKFREHPNVMRFIASRMLFADGLSALFTIGAVYVAGVLEWSGSEVAAMGILSTVSAVLGGILSGILDRKIGPKNSLTIELILIMLVFAFTLTINKDSLLFGLIDGSQHVWDGPVFNSMSDIIYALAVIPLSICIVASTSTARYMLVHISPPDKIGEFFGLYALTGTVTVWIGPAMVAILTAVTGSQKAGFAGLLILFMSGLYLLRGVKSGKTPEYAQY